MVPLRCNVSLATRRYLRAMYSRVCMHSHDPYSRVTTQILSTHITHHSHTREWYCNLLAYTRNVIIVIHVLYSWLHTKLTTCIFLLPIGEHFQLNARRHDSPTKSSETDETDLQIARNSHSQLATIP